MVSGDTTQVEKRGGDGVTLKVQNMAYKLEVTLKNHKFLMSKNETY